jgi:hypothetical protein
VAQTRRIPDFSGRALGGQTIGSAARSALAVLYQGIPLRGNSTQTRPRGGTAQTASSTPKWVVAALASEAGLSPPIEARARWGRERRSVVANRENILVPKPAASARDDRRTDKFGSVLVRGDARFSSRLGCRLTASRPADDPHLSALLSSAEEAIAAI